MATQKDFKRQTKKINTLIGKVNELQYDNCFACKVDMCEDITHKELKFIGVPNAKKFNSFEENWSNWLMLEEHENNLKVSIYELKRHRHSDLRLPKCNKIIKV